MDKNICLFLLPNLFIICRSWPAAACNSGEDDGCEDGSCEDDDCEDGDCEGGDCEYGSCRSDYDYGDSGSDYDCGGDIFQRSPTKTGTQRPPANKRASIIVFQTTGIIHELIEFDRLLKLEELEKLETNLPNNYQGIIMFMNGEKFSHYYECHVKNHDMKWQIVNKKTELDELFNFLGLDFSDNQQLIQELSSAIDDEYGIYSSYKVKYDYDFDTHVYKSRNNIDSDLHFLINMFKKNIL